MEYSFDLEIVMEIVWIHLRKRSTRFLCDRISWEKMDKSIFFFDAALGEIVSNLFTIKHG